MKKLPAFQKAIQADKQPWRFGPDRGCSPLIEMIPISFVRADAILERLCVQQSSFTLSGEAARFFKCRVALGQGVPRFAFYQPDIRAVQVAVGVDVRAVIGQIHGLAGFRFRLPDIGRVD